jgi:hypothetical protein
MTLVEAITPASVERWLLSPRRTCRASTLVHLLTGLAHAAWMLEPETDWRWVARHRLRPTPTQVREEAKPKPLLDVPLLVAAALRRAEDMLRGPVTVDAAIEARDPTIDVVGALTALRVGNLASFALGRHVSEVGGALRVEIPAAEIKTRRYFTTIVPALGTQMLRAYLDVWRPALLGDHPEDGGAHRIPHVIGEVASVPAVEKGAHRFGSGAGGGVDGGEGDRPGFGGALAHRAPEAPVAVPGVEDRAHRRRPPSCAGHGAFSCSAAALPAA